jgi:hypothetical protein
MAQQESKRNYDVVVTDVLMPKRLSTRYERALGRLAIQFSLLHRVTEAFAWQTWGLHKEFRQILTKDLPFKQLVIKLRASIEELELETDDNTEVMGLLKKVEKQADKRNDLLHALWIVETGKPVVCILRREKEPLSKAPTVKEIDELSQEIGDTASHLFDFANRNTLMTPIAIAQKKKYGSKKDRTLTKS